MNIERPNIKTDRYWMNDYRDLWQNFIGKYNDGKKLGEQLRPRHGDLYRVLVIQASHELKENNKSFIETPENAQIDSSKWLAISGSVHLMASKLTKVSAITVRRLYDRLEEAGVIKRNNNDFLKLIGRDRINTYRRKEVLINPNLLLIHDLHNAEYTPTSPYLGETQKRGFQKERVSNCIGVSSIGTVLDSNKNEIMPVEIVEKGVSPAVDGKQLNDSNNTKPDATPKQVAPRENRKENNVKKCQNHCKDAQNVQPNPNTESQVPGGAPETVKFEAQQTQKRDRLADLKRALAVELYTFMVQMLFKFHNIYPAEATMSINYLQEVYFSTVTNGEHGNWMIKRYKWRVSKAASYIHRHNFDFSNTYPLKYLNINNKKGFAATKKWYKKHVRDNERKQFLRKKGYQNIAEQSLMLEVIQAYKAAPTIANFQRQTALLANNHPHLLNHFVNEISRNSLPTS